MIFRQRLVSVMLVGQLFLPCGASAENEQVPSPAVGSEPSRMTPLNEEDRQVVELLELLELMELLREMEILANLGEEKKK